MIRLVRLAKPFVFLRRYRHVLFDEAFQAELAEVYLDSPKGQPPVPPASGVGPDPAGLYRRLGR